MQDVDLIVVAKDKIDYSRSCIESIFNHVYRFHLILVDNASTDGTSQYFDRLKQEESTRVRVTVIHNKNNEGYVKGINQGIQISKSPYVVFSNNDVVLYPGTIEEMIFIAEHNPEIGLINPNSNEFGFNQYNRDQLQLWHSKWIERLHASGFFVLVKRQVIRAIGGLDRTFSPGYFDDMDFSERAKRAGFLCVMARGAYVYHFGTRSFPLHEKQKLWDEHQVIFDQRWGGAKWFAYLGDEETLSDPDKRSQVIDSLLEVVRKESAICYLYLPKGSRHYFENLHVGFRAIETHPRVRSLQLFIKILYRRSKPIIRVYVSQKKLLEEWQKLKFWHHVGVFFLERPSFKKIASPQK